MRFATAYRRPEGYYVHSNSQTTCGVWVATEPFIKIPVDAPIDQLGKAIEEALERSKIGMAHPSDWSAIEYPLPELAGVKTWAAFMKHAKCANIKDVDNHIEFIPNKNLGPEKGFEQIEEETIAVPIVVNRQVGPTLLDAFERCR